MRAGRGETGPMPREPAPKEDLPNLPWTIKSFWPMQIQGQEWAFPSGDHSTCGAD